MDRDALRQWPVVGDHELQPRVACLFELLFGGRPQDDDAGVGRTGLSTSASATVAVQSAVAPAPSAAPPTSIAPWP